MSRYMKWAFLAVVLGVASLSGTNAQAQGISLGISGANGSFYYSNTPAYVVRPYPYYVAPRVIYPAPPPYPVYYGPRYPYPRPYYPHHHHHHHHH
jgi:hypothetical protein